MQVQIMYCQIFTILGDQGDTSDKTFTAYSSILGSRGWRITVHEQHTLPVVFGEGFDILPGRSTSVALSSTQISQLSAPYTGCVDEYILPKTNYKLTQSTCRIKCMRRAIELHCGCIPVEITPYHYPEDVYCLTYNLTNITKVFEQKQCEDRVKKDRNDTETFDGIKNCEQFCNLRCNEIEYNMQMTTSVFPTPEVMSWFYTFYIYNNPDREKLMAWKHFNDPLRPIKGKNKTAEDYLFRDNDERRQTVMTPEVTKLISESFARVNIYFKDVTVLRKKQSPSYNLGDLFADIGGVLGLWVGVSVITILEVLTLFSELMCLPCTLKKRGN